ncbi:hypothetical protein PybrP1_005510 [[Pythium] brassicae (nom. inval.)]|nr:hypothetical protein PybrP1_005510 [[Pythium] brassicae (nom. inval.)]
MDATGASLPLLAPPSGDTLKFRHRHNALDELEEEALRAQLRQHLGAPTRSARAAKTQQERYRDAGAESTPLTAAGPLDALPPLSALWASSASLLSVSEVLKLVQRMLWFADDDMAEEVDESDPKVAAGKKFLAGVEAFAMLTDNELAQLVGLCEFRAYAAGETVIEDERSADGLYVVVTGGAARFPAAAASDSDSAADSAPDVPAAETFAYQEHFGVLVSPTEATSVERAASAVVATSESLECLWLPELVVRMLNLQPRLEHEFALLLHNDRALSEELLASQEQLVRRLLRAGLHVTVLANTRNTRSVVVLLLSAPLWLLAREDKLMAMERVIASHAEEDARGGGVGDDYECHGETMPASDRVAAFASILTRSAGDKPPGVGLRGLEHNLDPVVRDVFPLHDPSMTDFILSTWSKETHSAATTRLFLLRVKDYFGLRVAFVAAFVRLYNAALVYPLNAGALLWLIWRWVHYRSYVQALGVYGLGVAFVWAPSFLKRWQRYQNSLLVEWNLLGTADVAQPNPEFRDFVVETINVAAEGETPDYVEVKTYDPRRRWPKYAIFAVFCTACLVLLFVFVGVYVQWYIIAVMTPMCTDPRCPAFFDAAPTGGGGVVPPTTGVSGGCVAHCNELFAQGKAYLFMKRIRSCAQYCDAASFDRAYYRCDAPLVGCFATERGILGTARWFYVLVQGVVLGLTLDIVFLALFEATALAFNRWENYPTEQERETRCIEKLFLFNWVGYFYWFFLLAFVYVPNGDAVQRFVQTHVDARGVFARVTTVHFSRYWVDGLISMDSAFVTPMIVTQALNLVINTFVPYLLRRAIIRARDSYHVKRERLSSALKKKTRRTAVAPLSASGMGDALQLSGATAAGLNSSGYGDYSLVGDTDQWLRWSEHEQHSSTQQPVLLGDRDDGRRMLAEREPIPAKALDAAVRELFESLSSHDQYMSAICGGLSKDDLDAHQLTSYDWLDRVTRSLAETGCLRGGGGLGLGLGLGDAGEPAAPTVKLRLVTEWQCRNYNYTADRVLEESSMPTYSPFGDLLHLAIQFSYTIMFSVVWPFCCLCAFARNAVALRFDAIRMTIDCKRPVPRRAVGIGPWLGAFLFELAAAQVVVPALFVYVSGQLDAFFRDCDISEARYGPAPCLSASTRLVALVSLENAGIALCLLVYWKKSAMSDVTRVKVVAHSRRLRHSLRKSVRMIGETVLVSTSGSVPAAAARRSLPESHASSGVAPPSGPAPPPHGLADADPTALFTVDLLSADDLRQPTAAATTTASSVSAAGGGAAGSHLRRRRATGATGAAASHDGVPTAALEHGGEWREGTVSWVKSGRVKVNFSGGRQLSAGATGGGDGSSSSSDEVWLGPTERLVLMEPTPVKVFEVGMPVLLASTKFGRWVEATVTGVDTRDRFGHEVAAAPNEMHVRVVEAQNLRVLSRRRQAASAAAFIDPYCVLRVEGVFTHATSTKRRSVNPVWDEAVDFPLLADADAAPSSLSAWKPATAAPAPASVTQRTIKVSVLNCDPCAMNECLGEVELELRQFRDGRRRLLLVPLAQRRHVWTAAELQALAQRQAGDYSALGRPHVLLELQWLDTRLPTRVAVRARGRDAELVLSRKFCETGLCYGIDADQVVLSGGAGGGSRV